MPAVTSPWPCRMQLVLGLLLLSICICSQSVHCSSSRDWLVIAHTKTEAMALSQAAVERAQASDQTFKEWFEDYKEFYSKQYTSTDQDEAAFANFKRSMKSVLDVNSDASLTYWASGNMLSDMSQEELEASLLTITPPTDYVSDAAVPETSSSDGNVAAPGRKMLGVGLSAARQVDWRVAGKVSSVKYQGKCGACWAFSAAGAIESAYLIHYDLAASELNIDLSEQQLIECVSQASGCAGGGANAAFNWAATHQLNTESDYPFTVAKSTAGEGACSADVAGASVQLSKGVQWGPSKDEQLLMALVAQQPVVAYFHAQSSFVSYAGGVYQNDACSTKVNHALLIVGYLWTGSSEGSSWIVKNSWGPFWGDAGYSRIAMTGTGTPGTCGLYLYTMYPSMAFTRNLNDD